MVTAADEATSWSSQYFVQTMTRMADSSRAKVKEVIVVFDILCTVVSLWWVTPGAATEGVTPLFFPEKPDDLF